MTTRIRGIRSPLPTGYIIGRTDSGQGAPHLIKADKSIKLNNKKIAANFGVLTGDISVDPNDAVSVLKLLGIPLDVSSLTNGFVLTYDSGTSTLKLAAASGSGGSSSFIGLTDVPASYSGAGLKGVRVNSGATALEFHAPAFLDLIDGPGSYSGGALKAVRVNAGGTALEFYTPSSGGATAFTGLSDVPASYTGQALKVVRVNAGETALEFATSSGGGYSAGTPPTIVQTAVDNTGAATLTFGSAPTNGNLIVVHAFNPTVNTAGSGYTIVGSNGSGTDFGFALTKTAGASEPTTQTVLGSSPGGTGVLMGWELNNANALLSVLGQPEQSGVFSVALTANISNNCLVLSSVASPTPGNITTGYNVGNQDALIANSGNRRILAGHGTLADFPFGGLFCKFASSASSKSVTTVFIN